MASIIGVETLQHTNGTTAMTIDSSGRIITPARPAFSTRVDVDQSFTTASTWHTVDFNTGSTSYPWMTYAKGGATVTNGVFTVSLAGLYSFSARLRVDSVGSGYLWSILSVNNSTAPNVLINDLDGIPASNYTTMKLDGVYDLSVGDTVSVKLFSSSDTSFEVENYSSFQGYFLG